MAFYNVSSAIGVDFNSTSTTALFTLNDVKRGSNDTEWTYVKASGALITGQMVTIASGGTAIKANTTSLMTGSNDLGFVQGNFADQEYGWVVKRGMNVSVLCSGTCAPNALLYLSTNSNGGISTTAGSGTLAGIQLLASASTASLVLTTAILTYPRCTAVTSNM